MSRYRSTARFLFAIPASWLFVSLALGAWIEFGDPPFVDPVFASRLEPLRMRYASRPDAERLLCLGSSRLMSGVDADILGSSLSGSVAFNFGVPAGGPVCSNVYLRRLLDRGIVPHRLILEVLPPFLAGQNGAIGERRWLTPDRLHPREAEWFRAHAIAMPVPSRIDQWSMTPTVWRQGMQIRTIPNWVAGGSNLAAIDRMLPSGFVPWQDERPDAGTRPAAVENTRRQYCEILEGFEIGAPMLDSLSDTLALCRDRGIRTTIVLMPEASEFRGWYPAGAEGAIRKAVETVARSFGASVIDDRRAMPDESFADGHHLNRGGAEMYTRILARQIESGGIR